MELEIPCRECDCKKGNKCVIGSRAYDDFAGEWQMCFRPYLGDKKKILTEYYKKIGKLLNIRDPSKYNSMRLITMLKTIKAQESN